MSVVSAGILMYAWIDGEVRVFLLHPGGPFFAGKDSWGIPKGVADNGETGDDLLTVAKREFFEESGITLSGKESFAPLGFVKRSGGKTVYAWALAGSGKEKFIKSNLFELEWPLKSGSFKTFPEADGGKYFSIPIAGAKIHQYQLPFLDRLSTYLQTQKITHSIEVQKPLF